MTSGIRKVAVVGGGIAGLTACNLLAKAGNQVELFESSGQFGGLGTFFSYNGSSFERFYHCMLPTDNALLGSLEELNIKSDTYWCETSFGYLHDKRMYPLNTALDLLKFSPLTLSQRVRVGLTGLYAAMVSSKGLDEITSANWLRLLSGNGAFEMFWRPMLRAKFGDRFEEIPALWFWTRYNREKGGKKEVKGYIRGGYKHIIDTLVRVLDARGVALQLQSPVTDIDCSQPKVVTLRVGGQTHFYDQILITTPASLLDSITTPHFRSTWLSNIIGKIDMLGVVNVVLLLKKSLSNFYWIATTDSSVPFQGIVQTSNVIRPNDRGGYHAVHLMNYVHRDSATFKQPSEQLLTHCVSSLLSLFPELSENDIAARLVFRAPFVEPIYSCGYLNKRPPEELVPGRAFLATATQVYPTVTSWNGSIELVQRVVDRMITA